MDRYQRQVRLPYFGESGQEKLRLSRVLLVGCGALGTVIADQLVRAGIGLLRICDRDLVEESNLQRQVLFDEQDARDEIPKAVAAQRRLQKVNSSVEIDAHVVDVHSGNIETLAGVMNELKRADLILDGTDNADSRYLINDVSVKHGIPWVYGACVGTEGRVMGIVPGQGACLRCLFEQPPGAGELETCETAGVLGAAANVIASLQVVTALQMLTGAGAEVTSRLTTADVWLRRFRDIDTFAARREDCPCCDRRQFEFLNERASGLAVALCGRGAVQIRPMRAASLELSALRTRLASLGDVTSTDYFVRFTPRDGKLSMSVFPDGRAMVHGTADPAAARSLYARYLGS